YEALHAAIQAKADSVYFGVGQLNMRARAAVNFTIEDLSKIVSICQINKVKTYLTLNTIIYDQEMEEMKRILNEALKQGISAVIASDWAVITYARQIGLEVHISTQCNITNLEAVKLYAPYADVMVMARELSLEQVAYIIKQIEKENILGPKGDKIKIEIFAHGALCMAVSGKCYLSLDHYNQSANRGACLQLCRRPYQLREVGGEIDITVDHEYLLSPKDLKTVDFLDRIVEAGVRVLKIEGRGRSADYVKTVTKVYKEATQAYINGNYTQQNLCLWNETLERVYNRGFWSGYYLGRPMGEWTKQYGSKATKRKTYVGKVTNYFSQIKVAEIKIEAESLHIGDEFVIIGSSTGVYEDTLSELRVDLNTVKQTKKGEYCSIPVKELLRRGDKVYRLDTPSLEE
ncbi:MAG: peptidase U32 family protein, partial [Bacteroidales bacterium]